MICVIFKIIVSTIANDPIIKKLPDNETINLVFQKLVNNIRIVKPIVWIMAIGIKLSFVALAIWALMWKLKNY